MTTLTKRLITIGAVALAALVASACPALAQVATDGDISPDAPVSAYLTLNNTIVLVLTGAVIPLVNGLLLRPSNPAWVKALVADVFAVVVHAFSQAIQADGTAFLSQEWFLGLAITIVAMAASYFQVWKPVVDPNERVPTALPVGDLLARGGGTEAA